MQVLVHDIRTVMIKREVTERYTEMETRMVAIQIPIVKEVTNGACRGISRQDKMHKGVLP
jgi:hypothetical protein